MGNLLNTIIGIHEKKKYGKWATDRLKVMLDARGSKASIKKYKHENDNVFSVALTVPLSEYSQNVISNLSDLQEKLGAAKIDFIVNMEEILVRITKIQAQIPVLVPRFQTTEPLAIPLGVNTDTGSPVWLDLKYNPHILIAGSTGKGKSVCLENIIMHVDEFFEDAMFIMVDPKKIELTSFEGIKKLYRPIITEPAEAILELHKICALMDERYRNMRKLGTKDFRKLHEPRLFVIVDEYADLMMTSTKQKDEEDETVTLEHVICRIAQLGRASGIHLIIATQRPSADVITGLIKNNIPTRIAFGVGGAVDSRIILDEAGAEKLPAAGFGLLRNEDGLQMFKGVFVTEKERKEYLNRYPKFTIRNITQMPQDESSTPEATKTLGSFYGVSQGDIIAYLESREIYRNVDARNDLKISHAQANELGQILDACGCVKPKGRKRLIIDPSKFTLQKHL